MRLAHLVCSPYIRPPRPVDGPERQPDVEEKPKKKPEEEPEEEPAEEPMFVGDSLGLILTISLSLSLRPWETELAEMEAEEERQQRKA